MAASEEFDARPVRAFMPGPGLQVDESAWPARVPAVAQLLREGLELPAGTDRAGGRERVGQVDGRGEPGGGVRAESSGGFGSGQVVSYQGERAGHRSADLTVVRGLRPRWSYFLRADTMGQLYTYLEQNPGRRPERLHELSHGEGFLEILRTRVNDEGFYLMDEPDAPLSFTASLGLAALLHDLVASGSQLVVATHSPVLRRFPAPACSSWAPGECGPRPGTT